MIKIKAGVSEDIQDIVNLHKDTFKSNFTTLLGKSFLQQYYRLFLNDSFHIFIAKDGNKLLGFIVGVDDYRKLSSEMKRNIYMFIIPLFKSLFNIRLLFSILKKTFSFFHKDRVNEIPFELKKYNEITSFAVDVEFQGMGIGQSLLDEYLRNVCNNSVGVFVTTDAQNNEATIGFYKKNLFNIRHSYKQSKKRKMYMMLRDCKNE